MYLLPRFYLKTKLGSSTIDPSVTLILASLGFALSKILIMLTIAKTDEITKPEQTTKAQNDAKTINLNLNV
jgi:hypothetical protein